MIPGDQKPSNNLISGVLVHVYLHFKTFKTMRTGPSKIKCMKPFIACIAWMKLFHMLFDLHCMGNAI